MTDYLSEFCTFSWLFFWVSLLLHRMELRSFTEHLQLGPWLGLELLRRLSILSGPCLLLVGYRHSNPAQVSQSMATGFQKRAFQVNKTHCANNYKGSAYISLPNVLSAKTSQVAKPVVNVRGITRGHKPRKAGPAMGRSTIDPQKDLQLRRNRESENSPILICIRNVINRSI